jgi:hypothetical protein
MGRFLRMTCMMSLVPGRSVTRPMAAPRSVKLSQPPRRWAMACQEAEPQVRQPARMCGRLERTEPAARESGPGAAM